MQGDLIIHLVWIAGTWMIEQGTDGISHGDLVTGVKSGTHMLTFMPLDTGVDQRAPGLVDWVALASGDGWNILNPRDWYHVVHLNTGKYIWCPPPAITDAALEQICETRHTRPLGVHIVLCPALMTSRWKRLGKIADAMFTIPVSSLLWGVEMHEPIVIALICHLLVCRPWQVQNTPLIDELRQGVSGVWTPCLDREWGALRKFWSSAELWPGV
jgi:hypothetical protein